jgi:hypothetical protein
VNVDADANSSGFYLVYPYFTKTIIPANTYEGVTYDSPTFIDSALWVANSSVSSDIVYEMLSLIYTDEGLAHIKAQKKVFENMSVATGTDGIITPFHPGAARFWIEKGVLLDTDNDGIPDISDTDDDNDGVADEYDYCPLMDSNGIDADANGCEDSFDELFDNIVTLVTEGAISEDLQTSLTSKVGNALKSSTKNNICAAVHQLEAFQNQIEAQRGNKVDNVEADMLIAYAENLIIQLLE